MISWSDVPKENVRYSETQPHRFEVIIPRSLHNIVATGGEEWEKSIQIHHVISTIYKFYMVPKMPQGMSLDQLQDIEISWGRHYKYSYIEHSEDDYHLLGFYVAQSKAAEDFLRHVFGQYYNDGSSLYLNAPLNEETFQKLVDTLQWLNLTNIKYSLECIPTVKEDIDILGRLWRHHSKKCITFLNG